MLEIVVARSPDATRVNRDVANGPLAAQPLLNDKATHLVAAAICDALGAPDEHHFGGPEPVTRLFWGAHASVGPGGDERPKDSQQRTTT
jgi:hypothetical protein